MVDVEIGTEFIHVLVCMDPPESQHKHHEDVI